MSDPQIICPQCSTPIKLTESLAAPLIAQTRKHFEQQLASKEADFAHRETVLRQAQRDLAKAREAVDEEVAKKLKAERASISEPRARPCWSNLRHYYLGIEAHKGLERWLAPEVA